MYRPGPYLERVARRELSGLTSELSVFDLVGGSPQRISQRDKVRIDPALAGSFAEFQSRLSGFSFDGADFTVFLSADGLDN